MSLQPERILFIARDAAGRDAVVQFLRDVADEHEVQRITSTLWTASRWGDWQAAHGIPRRTLDSVVLPAGQADEVLADLIRFHESEERYSRLGLPWHRGYLFHGPPGTGKTSLAKALASELDLEVHYIPLSDLQRDTDLNSLIGRVSQRSLLLLEDIDIVHAAKSRDDTEGGISLTGLLNALDGVLTPHGLVTIMTTNDLDVLDPALRRPGRADVTLEIGYLGQDQWHRLCELIADRPLRRPDGRDGYEASGEVPPVGRDLTPAEVLGWAVPHLDDPEAALEAVLLAHKERQAKAATAGRHAP
jgi:chaperone BCS1